MHGGRLVLVMMLAVGCRDRRGAPRVGDTPAAPSQTAQSPLTVGSGHVLRYGSARMEDRQLLIRLTDVPAACGPSLDFAGKATMSLELPPGPGQRFFAGAPVGVQTFGVIDGERFDGSASDTVAEIDPFTLAIGARLRGKIDSSRGSGAFDAEICALESAPNPLPETVPEEPAAGTLDGRPFRVKKARIDLVRAGSEPLRLEDLRLFQDDASCASFGSTKSPALYFHSIGGAGKRRPLAGSPQPTWAAAFNVPIERGHVVGRLPAWIRFDRLSFEPGGTIPGTVAVQQVVAGQPTTRISGRFEAEICGR